MIHEPILANAQRKRLIDPGRLFFRVDSFYEFTSLGVERVVRKLVSAVGLLVFR
jgi:hypothetical protein